MILIECIVLERGGEGVNRKESCLKEQEVFVAEGKEGVMDGCDVSAHHGLERKGKKESDTNMFHSLYLLGPIISLLIYLIVLAN